MAEVRKIRGLKWAHLSEKGPPYEKKRMKDMTAAQAAGKRFEKKVAKKVQHIAPSKASVFVGQWIAFEDMNGHGMAQPDVFVRFPNQIILLECKRTQTEGAYEQMGLLYLPLLKYIFPKVRNFAQVQVCQNVVDNPKSTVNTSLGGIFSLKNVDRALTHEPLL